MPTPRTPTVAQITNNGSKIQDKSSRICILDVLASDGAALPRDVRSAYLHVPFCFHKCHYCDFYSIVDSRDRQAEFTGRLIGEIKAAAKFLDTPLQTVFIGGGTPTLLAPSLWTQLLRTMAEHLPLAPGGEFTVEANPETLTEELASILASGGVNRVSIGCQSFNPKHLKTLERWHDPANVHRSVEILRRAGIANFNLDLIFAIPGQSPDEWLADLDEALSLATAHLSCYGLVYEPNTPLTVKMKSGAVTPCDHDAEAHMYQATIQRLADAGFEHYEISNWARFEMDPSHVPSTDETVNGCGVEEAIIPVATMSSRHFYTSSPLQSAKSFQSRRCRHNLAYWTNRNWWAFGPSASGHVNGVRWKNVPRLGEYLEYGPLPPVIDVERPNEEARIGEEFMLGLRLIEGMELDRVEALLARGTRGSQRRTSIERGICEGLLERIGSRLRLRQEGIMLADSVLAELI